MTGCSWPITAPGGGLVCRRAPGPLINHLSTRPSTWEVLIPHHRHKFKWLLRFQDLVLACPFPFIVFSALLCLLRWVLFSSSHLISSLAVICLCLEFLLLLSLGRFGLHTIPASPFRAQFVIEQVLDLHEVNALRTPINFPTKVPSPGILSAYWNHFPSPATTCRRVSSTSPLHRYFTRLETPHRRLVWLATFFWPRRNSTNKFFYSIPFYLLCGICYLRNG